MIRRLFLGLLALLPVGATASPEPALFSRTQLKYGLERDDYLGRWVDRPLFTDPSLGPRPEGAAIHPESYRRMREMALQYGLDGFAFFPEVSRTQEVYRLTEAASPVSLLSEFVGRGPLEQKVRIAGIALEHPASFRLDGKVVFTSYGADRLTPADWQATLKAIRQEHGDHFLFLPAIHRLGNQPPTYWMERFDAGTLTPTDWETVKSTLREWLRHTDGLYFASTAGIKKDRRFHAAFYSGFIIRAMRETLAEPEFASRKYFGLSANIGHENATRFGYTQSSDGTRTLRHSLEAALEARPHLINIPEWDEQNENTSLRPTVYNGRSSQRLLRHYAAQRSETLAEPLPGDDLSIPNLVVSYRKLLTLGEALEVELLNVPDAAAKEAYSVKLRLIDLRGEEVCASPEYRFEAGRLHEERFVLPSEHLAGRDALVPVVEVTLANGEKTTYAQGWQSIALRPTWNWDYKWVKQPLRDLLHPEAARFTLSPSGPDGSRMVAVEFKASEPLAYLEVLDNDDVVYSHAVAGEGWRETPGQVVISLVWQSAEMRELAGKIRLRNAASARWRLPKEVEGAIKEGVLSAGKLRANQWPRQALVALSREEVSEAVFEIDLPGIFRGELPVARLLGEQIHGLSGPGSFNLVFSRYVRQPAIPLPLGVKEATFEAVVLPDLPGSLLTIQAIGQSGRIYRSRPIPAGPAGGEESAVVYSDTERKPVVVSGVTVPAIRYAFDAACGSILPTGAGRPFWGILGGFTNQATGRGGAESRDGTPFLKEGDYPAEAPRSAPEWVSLPEGGHALAFDGQGTYVALPQGVIPRRAGFRVRMEIYPEKKRGRQTVLANASYYPGSLTLYLEDGIPKASFAGENGAARGLSAGAALEAGRWSVLEVVYDQQHLWFVINGETSPKFPVSGPGLYDTTTVLGGFGTDWFLGKIRALEIHHTPLL